MTITVRFESTFPQVPPLLIEVDGVEHEGIARALALEALAKAGKPITRRRLDSVEWSYAELSGAAFQHCDIPVANFVGTNLRSATFVECDLTGAIFDVEADLSASRFTSCNLAGADLAGAMVESAQFDGCNLRSAKLVNLRAEGSKWFNCRTWGSDWSGANMRWTYQSGLEGFQALLSQFDGDEGDRLALTQYQAAMKGQSVNGGAISHEEAKARAEAARARQTAN